MSLLDENIPSQWNSKSLGSMGDFFGGVTSITKQDYGHGTPFLPFKNVFNNSKVDISALELMNVKEKDLTKRNCSYGDIFFTASSETDDEVAMSSVLLDNVKNLTYNGFCKRYRLHSFNELNPEFARYYFRSRVFRSLIKQVVTGDVRFNISQETLSNIKISIPKNIEEQKAIAKILTTFDDKIELLQAQNKTLETMARTMFEEWFGKYQIGDELPEGWRVGEFGEVIEFINGYAFKSKDLYKEPIDNAFKVFKMGDINKGGGFKTGKTKGYYPKSMSTKLNKYILKNGDLLMSMTDMKDAVSLLGHTALMIFEDEYIVNQRVGLIRVKNDLNIEYPYLYLLTNNDDFIARIRAGANSGVQVNLSTQGIKETEFIIADKETNKAFNNVIMPLFEKIKANSKMTNELVKTRDILLPKLISGQVRVNNIK